MVIVKLKGGLGDQMFQYAAGLGLRHEGESLYADLHALFGDDAASEGYLLNAFPALSFPKVPNLVHRIFNNGNFPWTLLRTLLRSRFLRSTQRGSVLAPRLLKRSRSLYLEGAFRNPAYFEKQRGQLLSDFTFPESDEETATLSAAMASRKDAVSISISRTGDEENAAPDGPSLNYYQACIAALRDCCEQPHFYIFTNDTGWDRQLLELDESDSTFIGPEISGIRSMQLKTQCAHHISAGTAEDWWAAWLSQRKGSNFIPSQWFGDDAAHTNAADLITDGWRIQNAGG